MEPERAAKDYYAAECDTFGLGLPWMEDTLIGVQKRSADRGDRYTLGFWRAVRTQFLVYESHFQTTGEFPSIGRDDPIEYLAMMFWDEGWEYPECALSCARKYNHCASMMYFERMAAALIECARNDRS